MTSGYDALRSRAAWLDLGARGRISVTGDDRARLLHAITTNHILQLVPGQGCYAFFLNAQGHIQADVNILCRDTGFLLDTEPETRERVFRHIDKYIIADDVTLEDVSGSMSCVAIEGPQSPSILAAIGAPAPHEPYSHVEWNGAIVQNVSLTGSAGIRIFLPGDRRSEFIARIESAGAAGATAEDARIVRLEQGKPRYGDDILDTTLPQETRQMHAVHFTKGCYLGQEIIERIRSRGHVNRLLVRLRIEAAAPLAAGARITAGGADAGEITSSAVSPALGGVVALAYVRANYAVAGTALMAGSSPSTVQSETSG